MKKQLLATLVLVSLAEAGAARAIDFDRGTDISEVIEQAKALRVNAAISYYRNACETITLTARDNAVDKDLVSVQYTDKITEVPADDQGYPAVITVPYETGRFLTRVSISRFAPDMYPWEKELFSVCALGSDLNFKVISGANRYKSVATITPVDSSSQNAVYELRAVNKLPMSPDPKGITVRDFKADPNGVLNFSASDKWDSYYAGETVRFTARVFENVTEYPDGQAPDQTPVVYRRRVAQAMMELPAASDYQLAFPVGQVPAGRDYGVSVSFSRIGPVSTPEEVEAAVFPL